MGTIFQKPDLSSWIIHNITQLVININFFLETCTSPKVRFPTCPACLPRQVKWNILPYPAHFPHVWDANFHLVLHRCMYSVHTEFNVDEKLLIPNGLFSWSWSHNILDITINVYEVHGQRICCWCLSASVHWAK